MYLASTVLKHFENQGRRATDLPLVEWSVRTLMYDAQEALHSFLRNFPNRWVATILRIFIFPRGRTYSAPSDELSRKVVELVTTPGEARERLSTLAYTTLQPGNPLGLLQEALELSAELDPIERRLRKARKEGLLSSDYIGEQIDEADKAQVISKVEAQNMRSYHDKVMALLAVDDFAPDELARNQQRQSSPKAKKVVKKATTKKATAKKKATRKKKKT
jgi:acyl-CoA dehydrogenase